jgi:hypothetical protein
MSENAHHDADHSDQQDPEEKKVVTMAIRLPIVILLGLLLMLAVGVAAMKLY